MTTPTARVLRGRSAQAFSFGELSDAASRGDGFAPLAPPPATGARFAEAVETGRLAGRAERDAEVAELEAEAARLAAALAAAEAAAEEATGFVELAAARLHEQWDVALRRLEAPLTALAVGVAESVLEAPLGPAQRAATEAALAGAVNTLAATAPVTVTVHPVDLLHLQETGLATTLEATHPGLRWEADPSLDEGDWAVSTAEAAVRRVRADMTAALRERLGLSTPA